MKRNVLLITVMLVFMCISLYAQTGQVTLQVYREPANAISQFAREAPMRVYVNGSHVFDLDRGESKEVVLPSGNHTLYFSYRNRTSKTVSFNASSGRVVYEAIRNYWTYDVDLVAVTSSSTSQSVAQQPQQRTSNALNGQTWYFAETVSVPSWNNLTRTWSYPSYTTEYLLYFGNGTYRLNNETGTYSVSGDTVTLTSSTGVVKTGNRIGNSLTIDGRTYTRIQ